MPGYLGATQITHSDKDTAENTILLLYTLKHRSRVNVYKGRNKQLSQMPKCLKHESATCIFITKMIEIKLD